MPATQRGETVWSEGDKVRAIQLRKDGLSAAQIAREMHCTRNVVIGRLYRMGVAPPERPKAKPKKPRAARITHAPRIISLAPKPKPAVQSIPRSEDIDRAFGEPCSLIELREASCRWPIGERAPFIFCNAAASEQPYCPQHRALAFSGK